MSDPRCPFVPEDLEQQGSTWVLANFHTHTPGSRDYASALIPNGGLSPPDIARGILEDCRKQGVRVLAVTDHNSPSFVRVKASNGTLVADPERESYYAMMRALIEDEADKFSGILVLPGMEIGAENIHVLGFFPPSDDPGWDVLRIAAILNEGNCPPDFYGDHLKSCTDFSVADAIDIIHERGGVAIPAHIDGASGFLKEETQKRLLKLIVSRPHLFAVEYLEDRTRVALEKLLSSTNWRDIFAAREGQPIAWTQSCDAHFVRAFNPNQRGNGKAIGARQRRTWLRLDPGALTFEAVRAVLMDPENRVRVDKTSRPRGRQCAYRPPSPDRTYVRALRLDWGDNRRETLRFNEGINAVVGPRKAGKTARAQAFSVIGGARKDLNVADPETGDGGQSSRGPSLKSVDIILERGVGTKTTALWWLHREAPERVYVAQIETRGGRIRIPQGVRGKWVNLRPHGQFDRRALRNFFRDLPANLSRLAPAVPQRFSLEDMKAMLEDPARLARFIEWHYVPDELVAEHRKLHEQLRSVAVNPGSMSAVELSAKLKELFTKLEKPRQRATSALRALYKNSKVRLVVGRTRGKWRRAADRRQVAQEILAMQARDPDSVFAVLNSIEDQAKVQLRLETNERRAAILSERVRVGLRGLLLVIGSRDLGPIVLDAPGAYFEPAELVETLAPLLLDARDRGAQFVVSIGDTNLPFAVDADVLIVCRRDPREGHVGPLNEEASGGLEKRTTAMWALRNLDGGGNLFARRGQHYSGVLGTERAERQRKVAEVLLAVSERKGRSRRRRK